MTNYERIMNEMTVEKLAVLLSENYLDNPCQYCMRFNKQDSACSVCADGIAEWLKQEAKEDAAD